MPHCDYHDQPTHESRPDGHWTTLNPHMTVYRCAFMDGWHIVNTHPADDEDDER